MLTLVGGCHEPHRVGDGASVRQRGTSLPSLGAESLELTLARQHNQPSCAVNEQHLQALGFVLLV